MTVIYMDEKIWGLIMQERKTHMQMVFNLESNDFRERGGQTTQEGMVHKG